MRCCPPSHDMPSAAWWFSLQILDYKLYVVLYSMSWYACHCLMDLCTESGLQPVCAAVLHLMIYLPLSDCFLWRIWSTTRMRCCPRYHDIPAPASWISVQNLDYKLYVLLSSMSSWYAGHCLMVFCAESGLQLVCTAVLHVMMICLPLPDGFLCRIWSTTRMCCCPPSLCLAITMRSCIMWRHWYNLKLVEIMFRCPVGKH